MNRLKLFFLRDMYLKKFVLSVALSFINILNVNYSDNYQSNLNFGYNLIFLILLICVGFHALVSDYKSTFRGKSVRMKTRTAIVVTFLEIFLNMVVIASGIIGAAFNYEKINAIERIINRVDEALFDRQRYNYFPIVLGIILVHHIILVYVDVRFWFNLTPDSWSYAVCYVYLFVEIAIEAQFALIVWNIKCRFKKINHGLAENLTSKYSLIIFKKPLFAQLSNLPFETFQNLHWSLCEAIQIINNAFGWQVLTSVLCICVHIIVTPYFLLLDLFYPAAYGSADLGFLILQVVWIITHHIHLLLIVIPASAATIEAERASVIICEKLHCSVPLSDVHKFESFLLQLRKNSMKFSACGLFFLQRSVVTSLIGSVVTYLVILIQFQNSDKVYH